MKTDPASATLIDRMFAHMIEMNALPRPRVQRDPETNGLFDIAAEATLYLMEAAREHKMQFRSFKLMAEHGILT